MAALTLGISATFPVELYAEVEKFASENGYTDKDGPKRGTAVTVLVAKALGYNMAAPASNKETPEQKKARETAQAKLNQANAKVELARLTGRNMEEATKALAEAQANLAALSSNGSAPAAAPAPEAQPATAGGGRAH